MEPRGGLPYEIWNHSWPPNSTSKPCAITKRNVQKHGVKWTRPERPVRPKRETVVLKRNVTPTKTRAAQRSISKRQGKVEHQIQRCMQKPRFWNSCRLRHAIRLRQNLYLLRAQKIEGGADPVLRYYSIRIKICTRMVLGWH